MWPRRSGQISFVLKSWLIGVGGDRERLGAGSSCRAR